MNLLLDEKVAKIIGKNKPKSDNQTLEIKLIALIGSTNGSP